MGNRIRFDRFEGARRLSTYLPLGELAAESTCPGGTS